jgi:hypothetical protein
VVSLVCALIAPILLALLLNDLIPMSGTVVLLSMVGVLGAAVFAALAGRAHRSGLAMVASMVAWAEVAGWIVTLVLVVLLFLFGDAWDDYMF